MRQLPRARSSSTRPLRTSPAGRWPLTTRHSRPPVGRRRRRRRDHNRDSDDERDRPETISPSIHDSISRISFQRHSAAVGPEIQTPPGCHHPHEYTPCGTASTLDESHLRRRRPTQHDDVDSHVGGPVPTRRCRPASSPDRVSPSHSVTVVTTTRGPTGTTTESPLRTRYPRSGYTTVGSTARETPQ